MRCLIRYETAAGFLLSAPFKALPSKRELPDYFDVISEPMSLNKVRHENYSTKSRSSSIFIHLLKCLLQIQKKLKSGEYGGNIQDLFDDMNLMFENCKLYNRRDSSLYKDGCKLQKVCQAKYEEITCEDEEEDEVKPSAVAPPSAAPVTPSSNAGGASSSSSLSNVAAVARKRMRVMYNVVLNHRRDGVQIIGLFMEKPSKKDYPDYYEVIASPIDMVTINDRIKNGSYRAEEDFVADMKLMFSNCRQYNEEGSEIYEDANTLEKVLMAKARELGAVQHAKRGRRSKSQVKVADKVKNLFETLRDHKDPKGRQLSLIFLRLPNQKEFPDYFEVIKNPIDFEMINTRLKQNRYSTVEECLNDFVLMFENACKFNEPDSQIYKDALTLQSLAHRTVRYVVNKY